MTRETKIALLVGLMFIICFGIILGGARSEPGAALNEPIAVAVEPATPPATPVRPLARPAAPVAIGQAPARRSPVFRPPARTPAASALPPAATAVSTAQPTQPASPAPAPRRTRTYIVAQGDTLWTVAGKAYGPGKEGYHRLIAEANRDVLPDPDRIRAGLKLRIPPLPSIAERTASSERLRDRLRRNAGSTHRRAAAQTQPQRAASKTYTVKSGDTLTSIARRLLGSASAANIEKLYLANRDRLRDRDTVPLGVALRIPR